MARDVHYQYLNPHLEATMYFDIDRDAIEHTDPEFGTRWVRENTNRHPGSNPGLWLGDKGEGYQELVTWELLRDESVERRTERWDGDAADLPRVSPYGASYAIELAAAQGYLRVDNGFEAWRKVS